MTVFVITIVSLAILHCIYLLCKRSSKAKNEICKTNGLKYKCPSCGSDVEILKRTDYNMYFNCSNPYCFNHGCGSADISYMNLYAQTWAKVNQERVPNPDNISDWDLSSAKDVEFTKVIEHIIDHKI